MLKLPTFRISVNFHPTDAITTQCLKLLPFVDLGRTCLLEDSLREPGSSALNIEWRVLLRGQCAGPDSHYTADRDGVPGGCGRAAGRAS